MLKTDWKQNLILLVFSFLMIDVLTWATLGFVAIGLLLVFIGKRPNKHIRNIVAIGVFASYWLTYGKIIDPEVGLNFLVSIIVLKILERETVRDRYMIFFGLLLLISAGSLFEKTLTYVFFFGGSFLILVRDFYSYLGQKWRLKDLAYSLFWVLPLTFVLFFFIPRMINPIPFQQQQTGPGEIGYTPNVNISNIESLGSNQEPVFQVVTSSPLKQDDLYWRGNTLSYSDGWNWTSLAQDAETPDLLFAANPSSTEVKQTFRTFGRSEYFFTLDYPRVLSYGDQIFRFKTLGTLQQRRYSAAQRYEAISNPRNPISELKPSGHYLNVSLSKMQKERIKESFPGTSLDEIQQSIRSHFLKKRFSYSLTPGRSGSFEEFMERKIGFCSHYASAVALILRTKGIPARLVSGFMGGTYNRFADFYLVSQNDAHVWVEAFYNGSWQRLDPTEWIAPDRVQLGGDAYVESVVSARKGSFGQFFKAPRFFREIRLWFDQWDFKFYRWLEEMDYHSQEALLDRFNFKRKWLFTLIPLLMAAFMLAYYLYLSKKKGPVDESEFHELWRSFQEKLMKKGLVLSPYSIQSSTAVIESSKNREVQEIWDELLAVSFKGKTVDLKALRRKIRRL